MPGGLLNLVAYGNLNTILNGNPKKTFFRTTYAKYTNFGLQRFTIPHKKLNQLQLAADTLFEFVIPRYADLLMDTYFVIPLPDIWSPIYKSPNSDVSFCQPYEFKWIENLGTQLIRRIRYLIGGRVIYECTGQYLHNMVQRDFSTDKKQLFDEMIGNTAELNDPANYSNRNGNYPNASYNTNSSREWIDGVEPSIRGRILYIPLNIWSTLSSYMAFPLTCLQYNSLHIEIECRPIEDLFVVRDIDYFLNFINNLHPITQLPLDSSFNYYNCPYIKPDLNNPKYQMFYFLENSNIGNNITISGTPADLSYYTGVDGAWPMHIQLVSTYAFLDPNEIRIFTSRSQSYLIKEVVEKIVPNVTNTQRIGIDSAGLVRSWMWFFQRSDVTLRNEWSNYSNWPYKDMPFPCIASVDISYNHYASEYISPCSAPNIGSIGSVHLPICPNNYSCCNLCITGPQHPENMHDILVSWGLLCDGKVREIIQPAGVFNLVEKYMRTTGDGKDGLYCYNFCLNTDPFSIQPNGAMNLSKFTDIEFEFSTILPYSGYDPSRNSVVPKSCDEENIIYGVTNPSWKDYNYSFNLHIMEERYNVLEFSQGMASLLFTR